jgi:hypothetical protein
MAPEVAALPFPLMPYKEHIHSGYVVGIFFHKNIQPLVEKIRAELLLDRSPQFLASTRQLAKPKSKGSSAALMYKNITLINHS